MNALHDTHTDMHMCVLARRNAALIICSRTIKVKPLAARLHLVFRFISFFLVIVYSGLAPCSHLHSHRSQLCDHPKYCCFHCLSAANSLMFPPNQTWQLLYSPKILPTQEESIPFHTFYSETLVSFHGPSWRQCRCLLYPTMQVSAHHSNSYCDHLVKS